MQIRALDDIGVERVNAARGRARLQWRRAPARRRRRSRDLVDERADGAPGPRRYDRARSEDERLARSTKVRSVGRLARDGRGAPRRPAPPQGRDRAHHATIAAPRRIPQLFCPLDSAHARALLLTCAAGHARRGAAVGPTDIARGRRLHRCAARAVRTHARELERRLGRDAGAAARARSSCPGPPRGRVSRSRGGGRIVRAGRPLPTASSRRPRTRVEACWARRRTRPTSARLLDADGFPNSVEFFFATGASRGMSGASGRSERAQALRRARRHVAQRGLDDRAGQGARTAA